MAHQFKPERDRKSPRTNLNLARIKRSQEWRVYSRIGSKQELAQELHKLSEPLITLPIRVWQKWAIPRDEYLALEWLRARPRLGSCSFTIGARIGKEIPLARKPGVHRLTCDQTLEEKLRASLTTPKAAWKRQA